MEFTAALEFRISSQRSVQSTKESDRGIEQESCTRIFRFVIYWDCQRKVEELAEK